MTQEYPHNVEAEQAVLGSILINPHAIAEVDQILTTRSDFFLPGNGIIYEAMQVLCAIGSVPDIITVTEKLRQDGANEQETGGIAYLASLATIVPTSINVRHYAEIVLEHALMRQIMALGVEMTRGRGETGGALADAFTRLEEIRARKIGPAYRRWEELATEYWEKLGELQAGANKGIPTGYIDFDLRTGGCQRGDLLVLGGRPSSGKSALALNIAYRAAKLGYRIYFQSLEMSAAQVNMRLLALESGIPYRKIRDGDLTAEEQDILEVAVQAAASFHIYIDESENLTIDEIRARIRRESPDMLIVDYLGFIKSEDGVRSNRVQEVDTITVGLKKIAKEMDIPVWVLSQLSREVDKRADHRPMTSDLRESGGIEQNADVVALAYREGFYDKESLRPNIFDLEIAKQRNGDRGMVHLYVKDDLMKFLDLSSAAPSPQAVQAQLSGTVAEEMPF